MKFQGLQRLFLLSVILAQIYGPVFSQVGPGFKHCCQTIKPWKESYFPFLVNNASYTSCRLNIIEFKLPKGKICFDRLVEKQVQDVISCIEKGRQVCLATPPTSTVSSTRSAPNNDVSTQIRMVDRYTSTPAPAPDIPDTNPNSNDHLTGTSPSAVTSHTDSHQAWPKVSDKKPPTSADPTTRSTANTDVSTQSQVVRSQKPTEAEGADVPTTQTPPLSTKVPDSDANGSDHQHDGGPPEGENNDAKMKQMKIAIISLLGIIFAITAVGIAAWCRRRRAKGNLLYDDRLVAYSVAPSEDSTV